MQVVRPHSENSNGSHEPLATPDTLFAYLPSVGSSAIKSIVAHMLNETVMFPKVPSIGAVFLSEF